MPSLYLAAPWRMMLLGAFEHSLAAARSGEIDHVYFYDDSFAERSAGLWSASAALPTCNEAQDFCLALAMRP